MTERVTIKRPITFDEKNDVDDVAIWSLGQSEALRTRRSFRALRNKTRQFFSGYGVSATATDFEAAAKELANRGFVLAATNPGYDLFKATNSDNEFQSCLVFNGKGEIPATLYPVNDSRIVGQIGFVKRNETFTGNPETDTGFVDSPYTVQSIFDITGRQPPTRMERVMRKIGVRIDRRRSVPALKYTPA